MSRVAWSFRDEGASPEEYFFEVNPKSDSGSFGVPKSINYTIAAGPNGETLVHEGTDEALKVSYSGVLLSEAQYEAMISWFEKQDPIILTDDLGQESLVYLEGLEYTRAPNRHYPFRHEYSFTAFVLEIL